MIKLEGYEKRLITYTLAPEREYRKTRGQFEGPGFVQNIFPLTGISWKKSLSTDASGSAGVSEDLCILRVVSPNS